MRHKVKASILILTTIIASVFGMGFLMQTNAEEDNTPKHYKVLENNGDGTFALSLNVTGAIEPKQATANANILVIYDVSGSMTNDDSYIYTEFETGRYGKVGSDYVQLYTRNGNSYTALNNDTNSTATSLYYRTGYYSYTYHDYTGEKRYRHVTRGAATEQIVYNFAKELLSYNKTETATNVEMALLTFSTNSTNDNIVQQWTSKKDTFLAKLSNTGNTTKLNYGGGTNWEAAMRKALDVLAQADKDPTYVVFVTDGGPTLRVGGGQGNKVEKENYSAAIDEARNIQNYNTADHTYTNAANSNTEMYGIYAYGNEGDYLDDLIYYAHNGSERTVSTDTDETPYYYNASDEKELEDAITEILTSIVTAIGVTDVSINDGTTSNVQLSSGEIVDLLTIDESSFTYWMSKEVKKDSNGRMYTDRIDRNNGETFNVYVTDLGNNQVRCTWTRPSDNVSHDITVTGYIKDDVLSIQWKTAEEGGHSPELFFNQDPPAAYVEDGTVKWDISSVGTLLNGVTYTVKFDVWKTQLVFDLIADLENNVVSYADLAQGSGTKYAGLDKYIIQECTGNSCSYRLITNTTAKLFYKDTRFGDELQEQTYDTPRGIEVASDTISIHKNWRNYYDDKEIADSITVELLQDGKPYIERTLSKQNGWRNVRTTYISPGLMKIKYTTDPETGKQIASGVEILDHGHDYAFAEPDDSAYNWQLVSETVHPMVLNGALTELIKIDSNVTNAFSLHDQPLEDYYIPLEMVNDPNLMYMTSNRGNHFVRLTAGGDVYLIADDTNPTIEAYNYRRSNLNIKKIIDGTSAPDDTLFTFDITVNDTGLNGNEKLYFSVYDNGFIDLGANLLSTGWTKEIKEGNWTGYYYAENNTPLSVKLTKTQNLRFNNLTTEATFTATEKDLPNKFTYTDTKVTAWYGNTDGEYLKDNDLKYNINKANKTVSGSITMTNTSFYVDMINTYQSTDIKVNKIWEDNNDQDGIRPKEIIVTLYADGNPIINTAGENVTGTITGTGNNWNYTFADLPRFNNEGKEITYTVQETTIENYKATYSEDKLTITNTHKPELTDITVNKIWEDKNNQDKLRPNSVKVTLYANGEPVLDEEENPVTGTITGTGNTWTYTFKDLDKKASGKDIIYTVKEETIANYTTTYSEDGLTITNTHEVAQFEYPVEKTWRDDNNRDGIRPTEITVNLLDEDEKIVKTIKLTAENNWTGKFENVDKYKNGEEIAYTIQEVVPEGYTATYSYNSTNTGAKINNIHDPETTKVTVNKTWDDNNNQDGLRPSKITVRLYADGTEVDDAIVTPDQSGSWTHTFDHLNKKANGKVITYTISEDTVSGYTTSYSGTTITNTLTKPEKTSLTVTKEWVDNNNQDGLRKEITIKLLADGTDTKKTITLNEANSWTGTFSELDKNKEGKAINYTVEEVSVEGYTTVITYNKDTATITNTLNNPEKTSLTVEKVWNDNNNQDGLRKNITVKLYADGNPTGKTLELNEDNHYTNTFTNLDKNKNGKEINYTIEEVSIEGYTTTYDTTTKEKTTIITNTHTTETTKLEVEKVWNDNDNQDGIRSEEITVVLVKNGTETTQTLTLNEANKWSGTFSNLAKNEEGKAISYTVKEVSVEGYTSSNSCENNHCTITNTHASETTEFRVTKVWNDDNNRDGLRPTSILFELYANGNKTNQSITLNEENNWTHTFTNLPKNDNGKEIVYSVKETSVTGYTSTASISNNSATVTNTHTSETTKVDVTKTWNDNNNQDGIRPEEVTIILVKNGTETTNTITLNKDNNWSGSFTNLPKNENGKLITYTLKEVSVEGYTTTMNGYNITNTLTDPEKTSVEGEKVWNDNNNQDGIRPEKVTINLYADGTKVDSQVVTSSNNWKYSFTNLDKNKNGKEITYTIDEEKVEGYTKTISGSTITNTLTNPQKTKLEVEKVWNDKNNQDGIRPASIEVTLYKNGTITEQKLILNEENNWSGSFSDLVKNENGKAINYTVEENEVANYERTITYDNNKATIVNKHNTEKVTVTGTKTWKDNNNQDGIRPEKITVNLYANGTKVDSQAVREKNGTWTYTFSDLPKYENGKAITYTIKETPIEGYESAVEGFNITNTHEPATTSVTGTKTWKDNNNQDGIRPDSITVRLYANSKEVSSTTVTAESDWTYEFKNLPKYENSKKITYTITEDEVEGYTTKLDDYDITNTHKPEVTTISGTKTWNDNNDQDGVRPERIIINLLANGEKIDNKVVKEKNGSWTYTFSDLPKYDNGKAITYTVEEVPVDGYVATVEGTNITNTHEIGTTSVTGTKTWKDNNNQDGLRPDSITVRLYANGKEVSSTTTTETSDWTYTFSNLPKYDNGKKITYTVSEDEVEGYTTKVDDYDITNTHKPEVIDINGTKTWNDADNQDGIRPDSITVKLYANGEKVDSVVVKEKNGNWNYSFTGLPKYENGEIITYTVEETNVIGYITTVDGFNITNTHETATTEVTGTKTWKDNNNQDGIRPDSITVRLYANGNEVSSTTVSAESDWTYTFSNLPKYDNGKKITYTITEDEVAEYATTIDDYDIINTHKPGTTNINGTKTWDDNDNQDGIRPERITVNLYADGVKVDSKVVKEKNGTWTYTFTDLPKYDNGKEISYTVDEVTPEGYSTTIKGYDITNTLTNPEKTQLEVEKVWNDNNNQDGIRPETITVTLYKNGEVTDKQLVLSKENNWTGQFIELDKNIKGTPITYTIKESNIEGYTEKTTCKKTTCTIENTLTNPEKISIEGEKIWEDNNNQDGIRPDSITINLLADGEKVDSITTNEKKDWKYKFTNLDKNKEGKPITYTIEEVKVEGYTTIIDGYNIKNTHEKELTEITGTKTWKDSDNQDGIRPESITVRLYANGSEVDSTTVTEKDNWTYTFDNLPKYENGKKINYTVKEDVVEGYTTKVEDYNITNTHKTETIDINGTKTWEDDNNRDGLRPNRITINLLADGVKVDTTTAKSTDWKYSFTNLPKYKDGKVITYTVEEVPVDGYTTVIDGYNITNTHELGTTSVTGKKTWKDASNQDGLRPDKVTINLLADGVKVDSTEITEATNWKYTFSNLKEYQDGKKINYTIEELSVEGYTTVIDGYNITNTHKPELTEVTGTKTWEDDNNRDGIRPNRITVYLYDGETKIDTTIATEEENWTYAFTDLPKYRNGELIKYTVSEKEVKGYTSTTDGYNITNTHTIETKDITGTKTWIDDNNRDGLRPASITVHLLADGVEVSTQKVTADTNWTYTFESMPINKNGKEITYSITEDEVVGYTGEVNGSNITNTHKIITKDIEITKEWVDNNNQDNLRPTSITVNLLANGTKVQTAKVEVEKPTDNTWKYTFKDVPMYENGKEITYTTEEEQVKDYTAKVEGFTIINTHNPNKIHITGEKTWDDEANIYGRPASIKVTLNRSVGEKTFEPITKEVTEKDNWKYDFGEFPEYYEGKLITYTITEEAVKDYTTVIDGYNIKNTYTPETISISGKKTWEDVDNQDGIRPDSITIELYANGELADTTQTNEENNWNYSFNDIVKYANGEEITYTIKEVDIEGYTTELTDYDITNYHTPETITYNIKKIWEDYNNNDNLRPDFIKVTLYKMLGDKKAIVNVVNIDEETNWTYTFKDLPRYDKGTEIKYQIVEDTVYGYTTNIDNVTINDENTTQVIINSTITNTHEKELTDISGTKTWDDDDNYDGLRPESININLYANGELQDTRTITEQDNWTYTFKDLLKYHEGTLINYTIDEDEVFGYIKNIQNYNIINKHIHETTSISGKKIWVDEDDKDGIRPDSVTIKLYANGEHIDTIILTKSNDWMYIFDNLDKYKDGKEIKYTIEEEAVPDYITIYDGYNIMNIHNPGKGSDIPPKKPVEVMPPKTGITGTSHPGNILMLIITILSLLGIRIKVKE